MGNFYANYTLKGATQSAVADALSGRRCIVTPAHNGTVVVFDEDSDEQDQDLVSGFAAELSAGFNCPVFAVLNHDDDVLWCQLFINGVLEDEYDSAPGYFDAEAEPSAPVGGDAEKLCAAFGSSGLVDLERVLRKSSFDEDGYTFAFERHADIVKHLGISTFGVGTSFASFENDELPEGLSIEDVMRTA